MNILRHLFSGKKEKKPNPATELYRSLYPEDVRYALRFKNSQMGKSEVLALVDRFSFEAVYLTTKMMGFDRDLQRTYMLELTGIYQGKKYDRLPMFLRRWLDEIPDDKTADGAKLAQLNRMGSEGWQTSFRKIAEGCLIESPAISIFPCLVAYTTMLGYHHFVDVYHPHTHGKIYIVMPDWIKDKNDEIIGYEVEFFPELKVNFQTKIEHPHGNYFFIDDTIKSGKTTGTVRKFWQEAYGMSIPERRIRVITDLRDYDGVQA